MTSPMSKCRGFSHPFVLLVRSTLSSRSLLESSSRLATRSPSLPASLSRRLRPFSSCRALHSSNSRTTKAPPTSAKPKPGPIDPATSRPLADTVQHLARFSYAQRLAMKSRSTMLYEAAPQMGFVLSSYTAGLFCFSSAAINSWFNVFNLPPGISEWVAVGFGVISFVFAAIGTVFSLRPASIIRSIALLPDPASQSSPNTPPKRVLLEVVVRRTIPLPFPTRRIRVEPEQVIMVNRMAYRPVVLSREQQIENKIKEAKRLKEHREYEMNHLMTAPFRDAGRASSTIMGNIRRGLTGEGLAPVFINGYKYKLDIEGGYALEGGQVLDRLVKIQHDLELARIHSMAETKKN
ncbi:hypothetical protein SAMD00023353_5600290 [Rosellinia necatrix]|uniref:Uncharacterized protein n=1 Tax=Rosellinia necatrix TaxID=77044 RepID=A0A1W2TRM2_ROSNE|nr:hypothetical protein SAMD00023353_5600290 [Rosellinia necatrix]